MNNLTNEEIKKSIPLNKIKCNFFLFIQFKILIIFFHSLKITKNKKI